MTIRTTKTIARSGISVVRGHLNCLNRLNGHNRLNCPNGPNHLFLYFSNILLSL